MAGLAGPTAVPIGAGGFGACFQVPSNSGIAFKVVKNSEHARDIQQEFHFMTLIKHHRSRQPQLFLIPYPLAFQDARHINQDESQLTPRKTVIPARNDPYLQQLQVRELDSSFAELAANHAVYAMERINNLPGNLSQVLLRQYCPQQQDKEVVLCRLYLGKESPINRSRFFNSRNFPIDLAAYQWLARSSDCGLPIASVVAEQMGRMLGTIHAAGYDGRDIEFVLAGSSGREHDRQETQAAVKACEMDGGNDDHASWAFHTFDFNQTRALTGDVEADAALLAEAFFLNDPYFPRPRPGEELYEAFKYGWYQMLSARHDIEVAHAFFRAIEKRQAKVG